MSFTINCRSCSIFNGQNNCHILFWLCIFLIVQQNVSRCCTIRILYDCTKLWGTVQTDCIWLLSMLLGENFTVSTINLTSYSKSTLFFNVIKSKLEISLIFLILSQSPLMTSWSILIVSNSQFNNEVKYKHFYLNLTYTNAGYLVKFRCMEESQARNIFSQLLSALEFCHSRNVVHRDIKVRVFGNILWIF